MALKNLWDILPVSQAPSTKNIWETGPNVGEADHSGFWEEIEVHLLRTKDHPSEKPKVNIWQIISSNSPSGLWFEVQEETILLRPKERDIWLKFLAHVRELKEGQVGFWEHAEEETLLLKRLSAEDFWEESEDETLILSRPKKSLWDNIHPRELTRYIPLKKSIWQLKPLTTTKNERYYVLKNRENNQYLRLDVQQHFLWQQADGKNTLQDIAMAFLFEHKKFDIDGLIDFLTQLGDNGFLKNPLVDIYASTEKELADRSTKAGINRFINSILHKEFAIKDIDRQVAKIYDTIGKYFYTRSGSISLALISVFGFIAFFTYGFRNGFSPEEVESFGFLGVIAIYIQYVVVVLIHELSHAMTVKNYKREVRKGGVMFYFFLLAFFVDTTDIWLSNRKARVMVSWAGPYSGLILAGLASTLIFVTPSETAHFFLYQFAFTAYVISIVQLNPLMKYDGYYILMDWLEIPRLREKALRFIKSGFWQKMKRRAKLTREDRLFTVFGVFSLLWTIIVLFLVTTYWLEGIINFARRLIG